MKLTANFAAGAGRDGGGRRYCRQQDRRRKLPSLLPLLCALLWESVRSFVQCRGSLGVLCMLKMLIMYVEYVELNIFDVPLDGVPGLADDFSQRVRSKSHLSQTSDFSQLDSSLLAVLAAVL